MISLALIDEFVLEKYIDPLIAVHPLPGSLAMFALVLISVPLVELLAEGFYRLTLKLMLLIVAFIPLGRYIYMFLYEEYLDDAE